MKTSAPGPFASTKSPADFAFNVSPERSGGVRHLIFSAKSGTRAPVGRDVAIRDNAFRPDRCRRYPLSFCYPRPPRLRNAFAASAQSLVEKSPGMVQGPPPRPAPIVQNYLLFCKALSWLKPPLKWGAKACRSESKPHRRALASRLPACLYPCIQKRDTHGSRCSVQRNLRGQAGNDAG